MIRLPAAAVEVGSIIRVGLKLDGGAIDVEVAARRFADPRPGLMVLVDTEGRDWPFGGATVVEVL